MLLNVRVCVLTYVTKTVLAESGYEAREAQEGSVQNVHDPNEHRINKVDTFDNDVLGE